MHYYSHAEASFVLNPLQERSTKRRSRWWGIGPLKRDDFPTHLKWGNKKGPLYIMVNGCFRFTVSRLKTYNIEIFLATVLVFYLFLVFSCQLISI
jgi:hypothetical protein